MPEALNSGTDQLAAEKSGRVHQLRPYGHDWYMAVSIQIAVYMTNYHVEPRLPDRETLEVPVARAGVQVGPGRTMTESCDPAFNREYAV